MCDPDAIAAHEAKQADTLKGWIPDIEDKAVLLEALEQALDYRGDITMETKDGKTIEGFIFDQYHGQSVDDSYFRIMPQDSLDKIKIYYCDLARLEFTGKDAAHGRTWENWLRRWAEKKLKGEEASIESEKLD